MGIGRVYICLRKICKILIIVHAIVMITENLCLDIYILSHALFSNWLILRSTGFL